LNDDNDKMSITPPSKEVLELLASHRKSRNNDTNNTTNRDVDGMLSPTIDDIISNLNPNRPVFPSPITLLDNTRILSSPSSSPSSSSPIHYPHTPQQFNEIDNKYNELDNDTILKLKSTTNHIDSITSNITTTIFATNTTIITIKINTMNIS